MKNKYKAYLYKQYKHLINLSSNYIFIGDDISYDYVIDTCGKTLEKKDYSKIHSNILPQPLAGDLENGKIFLCLLNPGFDDNNYNDERIIRNELLNQISQVNASMFWLKDEYKNTDGGKYWRRVFNQKNPKDKSLVANIQKSYMKNDIVLSEDDIFTMLSRIVVDLELFPYHSKNQPNNTILRIQSVSEILNYVHNELIPNAKDKNQLVCFIRAINKWKVTDDERLNENVFCYNPHNPQLRPFMNVDNELGTIIFNHIDIITNNFTVLL